VRHTIPTGQWFTSDDQQRWWFDTGSVALDFAYAGGFAARFREGPQTLQTPSELSAWLAERFPEVDADATERDLADGRALQRAIATISVAVSVDGVPAAEDVDVVNLFAATADIPPVLAGGSRQAGRSRARAGQAFSAMAREAIDVFGVENAERVRECAADDCHLVFFDESRSNNRRWCSMQRCGNRAKVRAHRSRASR
jgi:predicted RNA-binding Zn ribbon-like protein